MGRDVVPLIVAPLAQDQPLQTPTPPSPPPTTYPLRPTRVAGIAIPVVLVLFALLVGVIACFRRRHHGHEAKDVLLDTIRELHNAPDSHRQSGKASKRMSMRSMLSEKGREGRSWRAQQSGKGSERRSQHSVAEVELTDVGDAELADRAFEPQPTAHELAERDKERLRQERKSEALEALRKRTVSFVQPVAPQTSFLNVNDVTRGQASSLMRNETVKGEAEADSV